MINQRFKTNDKGGNSGSSESSIAGNSPSSEKREESNNLGY